MDSDRRQRPPYLLLVLGSLALALAIVGALAGCGRSDRDTPVPVAPASPSSSEYTPSWGPSSPALPGDVTVAWAYLDSTEGNMLIGGDTTVRPAGQLIVPGAAEVYLNRFGGASTPNPKDVAVLTSALAQNHDAGTELVGMAGGGDRVSQRIVDACQLGTPETNPGQAAALDVAHYAACLREGALIDPDRAGWVLDQMRQTAGGIGDVRGNDGGQRLAQFNATEPADGTTMRTGCMGIGAYWSAAVLVDWPAGRGDLYGVAVCAEVARTQFPPDTQQAPAESPTPAEDPSTA